MAKGRSAKAKAAAGDNKNNAGGTKKVSDSEALAAAAKASPNDWSLLRVMKKNSETLCKTDGCEDVAVALWENKTDGGDDEQWPLCESCQEKNHGGWPEGFAPTTTNAEMTDGDDTTKETTTTDDLNQEEQADDDDKDAVEESPQQDTNKTSKDADADMIDSEEQDNENSAGDDAKEDNVEPNDDDDDDEEDGDEDEEDDEQWDLKKILTKANVTKDAPIKCSTEECMLAACCLYVSGTSGEKWYSCIDCQETDYGGWPPVEELPVASLAKDHVQSLIDKCSKKKRPAMPPIIDESLSPVPRKNTQGTAETNTITPLASAGTTTTAQAKGGSSKAAITPTPAKPKQQSEAALKRHAEWQKAAIKAGGPDARIIVNKEKAKEVIFQLLYDRMMPMNITMIHTELKATVPSVVLKSSLDEMALDNRENQFYDSDDEDDDAPKKAKKKKTPDASSGDTYDGSLSFKAGRNVNSSLYYVDHTKQKNNGNGLEPDQRNELINNLAQAHEEESMLKAQLQNMTKETAQLLSEPTNEEATATLERQEAEMTDIRDQLEGARQLKVNEKYKKSAKRRIENLTQQWRKRRRLCMDFLNTMEESTDGAISRAKCLSGDGQIDIESDESAIKNAIAYGKKKRTMASRPAMMKKVSKSLGGKTTGLAAESLTSGLTADPNFVAVRLNTAGQAERVYIGDDE